MNPQTTVPRQTPGARRLATLLLIGGVLTIAGPAAAADLIIKQPYSGDRSHFVDVHAGAAYGFGYGFGLGGRFTLNLVDNGFIPSLNNSVGLGFGLDVLAHPAYGPYSSFGISLSLPVVLHWAFHLTPAWTVFAEVGVVPWIRPYGNFNKGYAYLSRYFDIWFTVGPGAIWHFGDGLALILRINYPYASVGLAFDL